MIARRTSARAREGCRGAKVIKRRKAYDDSIGKASIESFAALEELGTDLEGFFITAILPPPPQAACLLGREAAPRREASIDG